MKMLGQKMRISLMATLASALVACGGGGGGGEGSPPAAAVAITAANAPAVGAEALDASNVGLAGALDVLTGVQIEAAAAPAVSVMESLASAVKLGLKVRGPKALVGAAFNDVQPCPQGGTFAVSGDAASEERTSVGDTFQATFRNCVAEGSTMNGAVSARVVSVNSSETLIVVDVNTTDFSAVAGGTGGRVSSALRVTLDATDPAVSRVAATGNATVDRLRNGSVRATRTLTDYTFNIATNTANGNTTETFSYRVSGNFPNIGTASFDARTTQALMTRGGATRPASGVARVTGANGSNLTITVVGTGVRLDIDANNDGTAEATQSLTWAQLEAQL